MADGGSPPSRGGFGPIGPPSRPGGYSLFSGPSPFGPHLLANQAPVRPPVALTPMAAPAAHVQELSQMARPATPPPQALSPMPEQRSAAAAAAATPAPAPVPPAFNFSQGHGAYSARGGLKKDKTEIRPSAVASVQEQRGKGISGGTVPGGSGPTHVTFVPRRSNPQEFRAIATKTKAGALSTSYPMGKQVSAASLARAKLKPEQISDRAHSPPPARRQSAPAPASAASAGSAKPAAPTPAPAKKGPP